MCRSSPRLNAEVEGSNPAVGHKLNEILDSRYNILFFLIAKEKQGFFDYNFSDNLNFFL